MRYPKITLPRRNGWLLIAFLLVILAIAGYGARTWYNRNLGPVSSSTTVVHFPVTSGSSLHEIAVDLKHADLIRSTAAFEAYVRGRQLYAKMQAGVYDLSPSMSTPEIVDKIVKGEVARNLLTILPGKTIKQIREAFKESGYSDDELDVAFNPSTYTDEPVLDNLPAGATLEGFLYPESFQKESSTPAQTIIRESLDEMQAHLTPAITKGFAAQGLNIYQGVTLASIVYKESGSPVYEPTIAQIFISRLKNNMMLGSDVTALYGAVKDGVKLPNDSNEAADIAIGHRSPYNTRINYGLPPGPINNMTDDALKAVAFPSKTDYLYFVNGEDCKLHFSKTLQEHNNAIQKYGVKECS